MPTLWIRAMLAVVLVSGLPLLITLLLARQEGLLRHWLPQLSAFGAGAVFAVAAGHLIPDAVRAGQPWWQVLVAVAVGFGLFALIEQVLAGHDHAHAHGIPLGAPSAHANDGPDADCVHLHHFAEEDAGHRHARALAPMAFLGDASHNFVDGSLIAAAFLAAPGIGVATMLAVALHELPREVGTFGLFVHGGIAPMRAVAYNAMTGAIALMGAALTLLLGSRVTGLTPLVLPVAAGTYLYIAQVVARSALRDQQQAPTHWGRLAWTVAGSALVLVVG